MDENSFLEVFMTAFDETEEDEFGMEVKFKDLSEWSSLTALGLLAIMEDEYDVTLGHNDLKNSTTIRDIFNLIESSK